MKLLKSPLTAVLSVSLLIPSTPGLCEGPDANAISPHPASSTQLGGDLRIEHALNRLTFGPRPGDVEAVRASGFDRWFEQQLHPAQIDNSALTTRLDKFPATQWSTQDLLFRLPSNAVIRQVINGKTAMPATGVLHAVYADQVERISEKRQKKAEGQQKADAPATAAAGGQSNARSGNGSDGALTQAPAMDGSSAKESLVDAPLPEAILGLSPAVRLERLVALPPEQAESFFKSLNGRQRIALVADLPPLSSLTVEALENPERAVTGELMAERLTRDIFSNTQLEEVMTDFWLNHFNVYVRKNEDTPYYLMSYERDVIRPRAMGKFEDLLEAVAHSPAMLVYLDNAQSTGPDSPAADRAKMRAARNPNNKKKTPEGLNENYARELMELHTLGVNGGYTQADVIQAARILTGWTVDGKHSGEFLFDEQRHEPGTKKVLGHRFKEHGEKEGRDLLHMLATRPATAAFLSRKLAVRFVSDTPPQALVDHMAKAYLKSGGDIASVLRTMVQSPEFWSTDVYRAKVKTPIEYVVSAARASGAEIETMQPLIAALRDMAMPLYGCIPPTGYKWDAADWVSTGALVTRMNFAVALASNRLRGITATWSLQNADGDAAGTGNQVNAVFSPLVGEEEARLEIRIVEGGVSASTRSAVLEQFQQQSGTGAVQINVNRRRMPANATETQDELLAGLLLGSPEFQRR